MADVENWLNGRRWWCDECISHHGRDLDKLFQSYRKL
jgi:hypothetical protein